MAYAKCMCHRDGCPLGFTPRCQMFQRHHPYVSESRVCGVQTLVTGARIQVSNGAATYMCGHPDFKVCWNKTTSVCQCTGMWENWTGVCGRFRWRNMMKNRALFLPCRSWEEFGATINLTLGNDSSFDVSVVRGEDMLFNAYFEFNEEDHYIICNSFIQNTWDREYRDETVTIGRECTVKITLRHGEYSLDLDGERRCSFTERMEGLPPEYIIIENEVTVNSVEIAV